MIRFTCLAILFASFAGGAVAQTPSAFDMKGTWKGDNEVIVDGVSAHHPAAADTKAAGPYRLRTIPVTLKIDGQDGRRFWGTMTSDNQTNRAIGSLSSDGKWIYWAGFEGIIDGQVVDANTVESCYRHASATSAVVGCNLLKRQK